MKGLFFSQGKNKLLYKKKKKNITFGWDTLPAVSYRLTDQAFTYASIQASTSV